MERFDNMAEAPFGGRFRDHAQAVLRLRPEKNTTSPATMP